jgi:hypothetical protein
MPRRKTCKTRGGVQPEITGGEGCLKIGDTWVHLRACIASGRVRCRDWSYATSTTTRTRTRSSVQPGEAGWLSGGDRVFEAEGRK